MADEEFDVVPQDIIEALKNVYTDEGVKVWLNGANRDLDGKRPIDLIKSGELDRVRFAIERLQAGNIS